MSLLLQSLTKKYFQFSGRSSRREYIYFCLFLTPLHILINLSVPSILELSTAVKVIQIINFLLFFPSTALNIRRLHDFNYKGWWFLLYIITISIIFVIYFINFPESILPEHELKSLFYYTYETIFINIYIWAFTLILILKKGTPGPNRFGDEPIY